jgi:hypothetical protein
MKNHVFLLLLCFVKIQPKHVVPEPPSIRIGPFDKMGIELSSLPTCNASNKTERTPYWRRKYHDFNFVLNREHHESTGERRRKAWWENFISRRYYRSRTKKRTGKDRR